MLAQILAVTIFVIMFGFIITEKIERHIVSGVCAILTLVLVFGVGMHSVDAIIDTINIHSIITPEFWRVTGEGGASSSGVNWETIIFIFGMMVMVEGMAKVGFFRWLCMRIAKLVNFQIVPIFMTFMVLSTILAMFIDSITVILFLAAVTIELSQLLMKNISKVRILEQAHLEPNQEKILQICGSNGMVGIDHMQRKENGLLIEGMLQVHILYNTTEDSMPYGHSENQIPFEQFIEIDNFSNDAKFKIEIKLEQLQVNLLDNTEYEIKAVLQIAVLVEQVLAFEKIVAIEEQPLDIEALQKQPGMIGCVRKEGEDLWDIAKRYHATAENIIEIGDKVLVVKQVWG